MNLDNLNFAELSTQEMMSIEGGGWKKDVVDFFKGLYDGFFGR